MMYLSNYKKGVVFVLMMSVLVSGLYSFIYLSALSSREGLAVDASVFQNETTMLYGPQDEWIPELPVRLVIPSIGVDAEVQYVGMDQSGSGEMAVPSNFIDVGWYKDGVRPGMRGSAVMAGHYNGKGVPEGVFYDLDMLSVGDEVVVMSAERIEDIFSVVRIETYDYDEDATGVFLSTDGKKRLNLITCDGEWLLEEGRYDKRTVVFTELLTDVE